MLRHRLISLLVIFSLVSDPAFLSAAGPIAASAPNPFFSAQALAAQIYFGHRAVLKKGPFEPGLGKAAQPDKDIGESLLDDGRGAKNRSHGSVSEDVVRNKGTAFITPEGVKPVPRSRPSSKPPKHVGLARAMTLQESRRLEMDIVSALKLDRDSKVSDSAGERHGLRHDVSLWRETTGKNPQEDMSHWPVRILRAGYLWYIDEKTYDRLPLPLRERLGSNAIVIPNMSQCMLGENLHYEFYVGNAVMTMIDSGLAGYRIIDAGAGDAMLSLAALKLGASRVDLVDKDKRLRKPAIANLEKNGYTAAQHYFWLTEDLHNAEAIAQRLPPSDLPTAIICNVGYWPIAYPNTTNAQAIDLVDRIPNVDLFIAAGYYLTGSEERISFRNDRSLLRTLGFWLDAARAESGRQFAPAISFAAVRRARFTKLDILVPGAVEAAKKAGYTELISVGERSATDYDFLIWDPSKKSTLIRWIHEAASEAMGPLRDNYLMIGVPSEVRGALAVTIQWTGVVHQDEREIGLRFVEALQNSAMSHGFKVGRDNPGGELLLFPPPASELNPLPIEAVVCCGLNQVTRGPVGAGGWDPMASVFLEIAAIPEFLMRFRQLREQSQIVGEVEAIRSEFQRHISNALANVGEPLMVLSSLAAVNRLEERFGVVMENIFEWNDPAYHNRLAKAGLDLLESEEQRIRARIVRALAAYSPFVPDQFRFSYASIVVLLGVRAGANFGAAIVNFLNRSLRSGTIHTILSRLEAQGLVESVLEWDGREQPVTMGRKPKHFYSLTPEGRQGLAHVLDTLEIGHRLKRDLKKGVGSTWRKLSYATILVLKVVYEKVDYGSAIMGKTGLLSGTVYVILARLEKEGYLSSRWEWQDRETSVLQGRPPRRLYAITPAGTDFLDAILGRIHEFYAKGKNVVGGVVVVLVLIAGAWMPPVFGQLIPPKVPPPMSDPRAATSVPYLDWKSFQSVKTFTPEVGEKFSTMVRTFYAQVSAMDSFDEIQFPSANGRVDPRTGKKIELGFSMQADFSRGFHFTLNVNRDTWFNPTYIYHGYIWEPGLIETQLWHEYFHVLRGVYSPRWILTQKLKKWLEDREGGQGWIFLFWLKMDVVLDLREDTDADNYALARHLEYYGMMPGPLAMEEMHRLNGARREVYNKIFGGLDPRAQKAFEALFGAWPSVGDPVNPKLHKRFPTDPRIKAIEQEELKTSPSPWVSAVFRSVIERQTDRTQDMLLELAEQREDTYHGRLIHLKVANTTLVYGEQRYLAQLDIPSEGGFPFRKKVDIRFINQSTGEIAVLNLAQQTAIIRAVVAARSRAENHGVPLPHPSRSLRLAA